MPRAPEGWRKCLTTCLYSALCDYLGVGPGVDGAAVTADEKARRVRELSKTRPTGFATEAGPSATPDWIVLSDWYKGRVKVVRSFDEVRRKGDYIAVGPYRYYRER